MFSLNFPFRPFVCECICSTHPTQFSRISYIPIMHWMDFPLVYVYWWRACRRENKLCLFQQQIFKEWNSHSINGETIKFNQKKGMKDSGRREEGEWDDKDLGKYFFLVFISVFFCSFFLLFIFMLSCSRIMFCILIDSVTMPYCGGG